MSYTTIIAVWPGEKHEYVEELGNSHGSGPYVWNQMCKKYYGTDDFCYRFNGTLDRLWPRWKDLSIPRHHRAVLMMTYDRAYIEKCDYLRASRDIEAFLKDFDPHDNDVNHWPRISSFFASNPEYPAIGFRMTSVSEDLFDGPWNEDEGRYGEPDWSEFFSIYRLLDKLEAPESTGK